MLQREEKTVAKILTRRLNETQKARADSIIGEQVNLETGGLSHPKTGHGRHGSGPGGKSDPGQIDLGSQSTGHGRHGFVFGNQLHQGPAIWKAGGCRTGTLSSVSIGKFRKE